LLYDAFSREIFRKYFLLLTATFIHDERAELFSDSCFIFHSKYDFINFFVNKLTVATPFRNSCIQVLKKKEVSFLLTMC